MVMEAVTRQTQGKECQGLPATAEARREAWSTDPLCPPGGTDPAKTLISDFHPPEL
jgi:hypothetical protein